MSARERSALIAFSGLFISSIIVANLIGSKLTTVGGLTVSVAVIVIPFTFFAGDLITEIFGPEIATSVVRTGLVLQVLALFFVFLGGMFPGAARRDLTSAYREMFSLTPRMVLASVVSYYVSQIVDIRVFHTIRRRTGKKWFWLRKNLSTLIAQAVDTALFTVIFLGGVLPWPELFGAMVIPYFVKLGIAVIDTPLIYVVMRLLDLDTERMGTGDVL